MSIFVILGLLVCIQASGYSTGTVFVQMGKDLFLEVKEHDPVNEGDDVTWRFNGRQNIAKLPYNGNVIIFSSYKGGAEMSAQNYSLLLKNVQKKDSGEYSAQISGDKLQHVAEYMVTVLDPVSPVNLTVTCSSSCNFTVTCSTVDSLISSTFKCDNQTCSQEGGERSEANTSTSSISVYLEQGLIICNHSNQVSWEQDTKNKPDCEQAQGSDGVSLCLVKTLVFSVGLIIMVSAVIGVHIMEKLKKQK